MFLFFFIQFSQSLVGHTMEDYVSVDSDDDYDYLYYDDDTEDGGDSDRLKFAETTADTDSQSVNVKVHTVRRVLILTESDRLILC